MVVKSLAGVWNEIACRRIHIKHYTKKILIIPSYQSYFFWFLFVVAFLLWRVSPLSSCPFRGFPRTQKSSVFCSSSVDFPSSGWDDFSTENKEDMCVEKKRL